MRIVGKAPELEYQYTCRNCGTIFAFYWNETRVRGIRDISGTYEDYATINCPGCGNSCDVTYARNKQSRISLG